MNERQLQSFLLAADCMSFSKAAEASHISTPALVQQINLLENNIGFHLFDRTHRGISLTSSGEFFYDAAKRILQLYESACQRGIEIERSGNLSMRISYPFEQFPAFLLSLYERFRNNYPDSCIDFVPIAFNDQISAITNNISDLSIIAEPSDTYLENLTFLPLFDDTYSFCMRPNHPLAVLPMITLEHLDKVKIICGHYGYLKTSFAKQLSASHAILQPISKEYDMSIRTERLMSDEIIVIHSLWSNSYESFLKVIPSNISAGLVGAIYRNPPSRAIQNFLPYLDEIKHI